MSRRGWVPAGQAMVTPSRARGAANAFGHRLAVAVMHHEHLWVVTMCHYASDQLLTAMAGRSSEVPILDSETITGPPMVGCYVCEEGFQPRLWGTRCPGSPGAQEPNWSLP